MFMKIDELIAQAEEGKAFQGKNELIRHYQGKRLTLSEAVKANCYECMGYYDGGAEDCGVPSCPLYPYAPYSDVKAPKKALSEGTRAKMRDRMNARKMEGSGATLLAAEKH
jgi:hypothetical protein